MNTSLLVPNFRDVGQSINEMAGEMLLKEGVFYRGGELGLVNDSSLIHSPKTIINLRQASDPEYPGVRVIDCPAPNSSDVYLVGAPVNRNWIHEVLHHIAQPDFELPTFVHCAAGKDRTGVIVAAVLSCVGIDHLLVMRDYESSAGPLYTELMYQALEEFNCESYFSADARWACCSLFLA